MIGTCPFNPLFILLLANFLSFGFVIGALVYSIKKYIDFGTPQMVSEERKTILPNNAISPDNKKQLEKNLFQAHHCL